MNNESSANDETVNTTVIDSSVIDEGVLKTVLLKAGRAIAQVAFEVFEMILADSTPQQARISLLAALTYLIMPIDLLPDLIPAIGFSDDLIALTAVINLWSNYMTPEIKARARRKVDKLFSRIS